MRNRLRVVTCAHAARSTPEKNKYLVLAYSGEYREGASSFDWATALFVHAHWSLSFHASASAVHKSHYSLHLSMHDGMSSERESAAI